jgi:hypothetical protein
MELIFVYNANSDALNAVLDFAHKIISPSTYSCDLCKLTHSNFGQRTEWKQFVEKSDVKLEFYHIDEFEKKFNQSFNYPIVLRKTSTQLEIVLNALEIAKIKDVQDLIETIELTI